MGLDRDRKFLNTDVTSTHSVDLKSVEPVQKHVDKCEQRIIPEHNAIILLNYVMNDIHSYQFEQENCNPRYSRERQIISVPLSRLPVQP